jgi:uncharacterized protein YcbK (DUF882 family)
VISRRAFLKGAFAALGACHLGGLLPGRVSAASAIDEAAPDRTLKLHNIHTDERLETKYCSAGCYDEKAIDRINYILRCHYSNTVKPISIKVVDLLCEVKDRLAPGREITIISGYRSPEYNAYLRRIGRHVAAGSLHMAGLAIDFAIDGIGMGDLCRAAKLFEAGGVGKYSEFVHIDVGRVRYW